MLGVKAWGEDPDFAFRTGRVSQGWESGWPRQELA